MSAFSQIYKQLSPRIYNTVLRLLNDETIAADVLQELFMTIWENRYNIDPEKNFEAYVCVIARNIAYRYVEERMARVVNALPSDSDHSIVGENTTDQNINASSLEEYVVSVVESLPETRKKIFKMSRFDQMSNAEIAQNLGISQRTVETHIYLALKTLKQVLGYCIIATYLSL